MKNYSIILASRYISTVVLRIFGALSLFVLTLALTRLLSVAEVGRFFHNFSIIMMTAPFALAGMNHLGVRYIAIANSKEQFAYIRGFVVLSVILVASISCLGALLWTWITASIHTIVMSSSSTLIFTTLAATISVGLLLSCILQGLSHPNLSIFCQSILPPIVCMTVVYIVSTFRDTSHQQAMMAFAAGASVAIFVSTWVILKRVGYGSFKIPTELRPSRSILFMWVVSVGTSVINWSPVYLLGLQASPEAVTEFNVAHRIAMSLTLIQIAVAMIVSPKMAVMFESGNKLALEQLMRRIIFTLTVLLMPFLFFIHYYDVQLLGIFSTEFSNLSTHYLSVFLFAQTINVLTGPSNQLLLMSHREREMARISTASGLLTIMSTLILLNYFGAVGAAYGMLIGIAVQNISAAVIVYRVLDLKVYKFARWK